MGAARREKKLREPSARNGAEMSGGLDVRILSSIRLPGRVRPNPRRQPSFQKSGAVTKY